MKKTLLGLALLCACLVLTGTSFAGLIGFDDLTPFTPIPNGYGGISTWGGIQAINRDCCHGMLSGYWNNNVSPNNDAFDPFAFDETMGGPGLGTFTLVSGFFGAAWNDGESLLITGKLNGNQVFQTTLTINACCAPTFNVFNWAGIDEVDFHPFGGVNHGYLGMGEQFTMDNLSVSTGTTVPEPGTMVVFGSGLLGLVGIARRKFMR